jgi:hypothetical protein
MFVNRWNQELCFLRVVDYPGGRRRITHVAANEKVTGEIRAFRVLKPDWSRWIRPVASGIDIDAAVLKRLTDKHHTEEHHAAQESAM